MDQAGGGYLEATGQIAWTTQQYFHVSREARRNLTQHTDTYLSVCTDHILPFSVYIAANGPFIIDLHSDLLLFPSFQLGTVTLASCLSVACLSVRAINRSTLLMR